MTAKNAENAKMDTRSQIERLHAVYCEVTGQAIFLNLARESEWFEWLRFRRSQPFTEADLRAVIEHRQRRLRHGEVTEAALKFSKVVGQPDFFEEDLGVEMARRRTPKVDAGKAAVLRATGREVRSAECGVRSAAEVLAADEAFKKLVEFRKTLE